MDSNKKIRVKKKIHFRKPQTPRLAVKHRKMEHHKIIIGAFHDFRTLKRRQAFFDIRWEQSKPLLNFFEFPLILPRNIYPEESLMSCFTDVTHINMIHETRITIHVRDTQIVSYYVNLPAGRQVVSRVKVYHTFTIRLNHPPADGLICLNPTQKQVSLAAFATRLLVVCPHSAR